MANELTLLNIDIDFINKPELKGNRYVTDNFVSLSDIKTNLNKYMDVGDVITKLSLKHKYVGQMTNSTDQVLPFYQRLLEKGIVKPKNFNFVNISSHCNIYSFGGHDEYEQKKEIHDYEGYQAFAYLFNKGYIDNMTWVYPDHYDEEQLDSHFKGMDYIKRNGYYIVSINQGLRFIVKPVKWSNFLPTKYTWKAISIITNKHTANFVPEDLRKLKELIF